MADDTSREYQAIDPKDKTRRESVELRFRDGRRYRLKHVDRHLMALSPDQKSLALSFYSMSAVILGRNLLEVATAIDGRNTPYLHEYDPLRWDIPTDPKAVVHRENGAIPAQAGRRPGGAHEHARVGRSVGRREALTCRAQSSVG